VTAVGLFLPRPLILVVRKFVQALGQALRAMSVIGESGLIASPC